MQLALNGVSMNMVLNGARFRIQTAK